VVISTAGALASNLLALGMSAAGVSQQTQDEVQAVLGVIAIAVDFPAKIPIDHSAPGGAGAIGGGMADIVGQKGAGEAHDPAFDQPASNPSSATTPQQTTGAPVQGTDGGAPDATVPDATTQGSHTPSNNGGAPSQPADGGAPSQPADAGTSGQSSEPAEPNQSTDENQSKQPPNHS
jgi:hypothetical protein